MLGELQSHALPLGYGAWFLFSVSGGANRSRTDAQGVAVPRLTSWLWRLFFILHYMHSIKKMNHLSYKIEIFLGLIN